MSSESSLWVELLSGEGPAKSFAESLLERATPRLYDDNLFRITGLSPLSSAREIARYAERFKVASDLGSSEGALPCFAYDLPPSNERVQTAVRGLQDPVARFRDGLWWFWPLTSGSGEDDPAWQALRAGKLSEAILGWLEVEQSNPAALHNLAILHHLTALSWEEAPASALDSQRSEEAWKDSTDYWQRLFKENGFFDRLSRILKGFKDSRLPDGMAGDLPNWISLSIAKVHIELAWKLSMAGQANRVRDHLNRAQAFLKDLWAGPLLMHGTLHPHKERLRAACAALREECAAKPTETAVIVTTARQTLEPLVKAFRLLLPESDVERTLLADEAAETLLECQLLLAHSTFDWATSEELLVLASGWAVSEQTQQKINQHLAQVKTNRQTAGSGTR